MCIIIDAYDQNILVGGAQSHDHMRDCIARDMDCLIGKSKPCRQDPKRFQSSYNKM